MSEVNTFLLELFRSHGVDAVPEGEWISFPNTTRKAGATIVREIEQQTGMTVQLDVRFEIAPGRTIVESFAGISETRQSAVADAFRNFTSNSFHVLLAAFFQPEDEHVSQEEWSFQGVERHVTIGGIGTRGKPPVEGTQWLGCFERFVEMLKKQYLGPETHWVRLYYGQAKGRSLACEVLLDNEEWKVMQSAVATFDWPSGEDFYSVRVFLVIHGEDSSDFTPERTVAYLAEMLNANPDLTADEVHQAMSDTGIPDALINRAYNFTQIAWGRIILAGMEIAFSADYLCFGADGEVSETGKLVDDSCFATASLLGPRYVRSPAFQRMALASAEVRAINNALHAGSLPENLIMAPAFVFIEQPTPEGQKNAEKIIAQYITSIREQNTPKDESPPNQTSNSRWRFWKR